MGAQVCNSLGAHSGRRLQSRPAERQIHTIFLIETKRGNCGTIPFFLHDRQNRWEFPPKGLFPQQQELVTLCIGLQGQVWIQNMENPSLSTGT